MIWIILAIAVESKAALRIVEFRDESLFCFRSTFWNGVLVENAFLNQAEFYLATETQDFWLIFEDAGRSGSHRHDWMFRIWLVEAGFSFFDQRRILCATIFYDGVGEIAIHWDRDGRLRIRGVKGINEIFYPWEWDSSRLFLYR